MALCMHRRISSDFTLSFVETWSIAMTQSSVVNYGNASTGVRMLAAAEFGPGLLHRILKQAGVWCQPSPGTAVTR